MHDLFDVTVILIHVRIVTLLAAMAARSIAVPLSPAFPAPELQYILNQSEASLLVSSSKFASKATEVLATELNTKPAHLELQKHQGGGNHEKVELGDADPGEAGMMLYTSGTTNKPVSHHVVITKPAYAKASLRKESYCLKLS
jgi:acyl-CoA synthetase (AMP-forming)/AMP-acid ligase II